jgi:hypothetical protein
MESLPAVPKTEWRKIPGCTRILTLFFDARALNRECAVRAAGLRLCLDTYKTFTQFSNRALLWRIVDLKSVFHIFEKLASSSQASDLSILISFANFIVQSIFRLLLSFPLCVHSQIKATFRSHPHSSPSSARRNPRPTPFSCAL